MSYRALYRTYRPQTFEEVVGQDIIVKTLQNSIINNKIGHAYLFCGPRGTGKTSVARIFAKALNCPNTVNAKPCNECSVCQEITSGISPFVIEIDAASNNGVDEIRELRDKVKFLPAGTKYKVYIIDEVHMLSTSAFNALLKTLEEPPAHAIFILATTEPTKVLPTIISRCQRYDFKSLTNEEIYKRLELVCNTENIKFEEDALMNIVEAAEGGMRDALSLLDQAISLSDDVINDYVASNVTGSVDKSTLLELARCIEEKKISEALKKVEDLQNNGRDTAKITNGLLSFYRDILMCKANVDCIDDSRYHDFADKIDIRKVYFNIDALNDVQSKLRGSTTQSIYLEVGLIKMISASSEDLDYGKRIYELEQKIENFEPSDSDSSNGVDSKRVRMLEEKYDNLISTLSKLDLVKLVDRVKLLEETETKESNLDETVIKDLVNSINRINEDLELLKVTQESLRSQIDNASTGGIDDDVLTERIETNLKKIKMPINYSEVETYIDKKVSEASKGDQVAGVDNSEEISELNNKVEEILNKDETYRQLISQLKEKVALLESKLNSESFEYDENKVVSYEDEELFENKINKVYELIDENNKRDDITEENVNELFKRVNDLEELILNAESKPNFGDAKSPVDLGRFEDKLAKLESNIYKIMSGMLNPQQPKKSKVKVDERQISLWSEDIVDVEKVEKPAETIKTDFEDLTKEPEAKDESEENGYVTKESIDEETVDDVAATTEEIVIEEPVIDEELTEEDNAEPNEVESNEDSNKESNLFDQVDDEESNEVKENYDSDTPLFEENLKDYYSESEIEASDEEDESTSNLFDSSNDNETINDEPNEESSTSLEQSENLEKTKFEEEQELEEERLRKEALEQEKREQQERAEKERAELEKIEALRSSGGNDLDEYERYDVKVLERILNAAFSQESIEDKKRICAAWKELKELASIDKRNFAETLSEGEIKAVGNHEFVLVYNNAAICNVVMGRKFKKSALKLLYDILGDYNYFAITTEVWEEKRKEYYEQRSIGLMRPTLSPIKDPNLRIVIDDDGSDGDSMIKKNMGIFGNNLNIK